MRFTLPLDRPTEAATHANSPRTLESVAYESYVVRESKCRPGVRFTIHRVSFGRRIDLSRRIRDLGQKAQFHEAGEALRDKIEANLILSEIEATYLRWGLVNVEGLTIDGETATVESLIDKGPEDLAREIINEIKSNCSLSETERKN
jgi:hypothetical protein